MTYIVSWRYNGKVHTAVFASLVAAQIFRNKIENDATITIKD